MVGYRFDSIVTGRVCIRPGVLHCTDASCRVVRPGQGQDQFKVDLFSGKLYELDILLT